MSAVCKTVVACFLRGEAGRATNHGGTVAACSPLLGQAVASAGTAGQPPGEPREPQGKARPGLSSGDPSVTKIPCTLPCAAMLCPRAARAYQTRARGISRSQNRPFIEVTVRVLGPFSVAVVHSDVPHGQGQTVADSATDPRACFFETAGLSHRQGDGRCGWPPCLWE
jgi:hypothetical protein